MMGTDKSADQRALAGLARAVEAEFTASVMTALPDTQKYRSAMMRRALQIMTRQLAGGDNAADELATLTGCADFARLAVLIRQRKLTLDDAQLRAGLHAHVRARLAQTNPGFLARHDRGSDNA